MIQKSVLLLLLFASGCTHQAVETHTSNSTGIRIASFADLNPANFDEKKAVLEIGGVKIVSDVQTVKTENSLTINLVSFGSVIESEHYEFDKTMFALSKTPDESYEPILPLVKFPMRVGDTWEWQGTVTAGGVARNAEAAVKTESDAVFVAGGSEAIKVEVFLSMDSGSPKPSMKTLTFWFAPDKSILKRTFGFALTRSPFEDE